ncbi:angiotensin-converting enzyme-like [Dreissena polymorpha]|uniref:Angiotensin-converting enzyme n=1 Tax=Dreissena polymorpha TaxID=45954 RepID=A0A9D3YV62_DREPO|nr:angiotensin-converting enzyme-like [Dreissena polymorpha]XP_052253849.1 angiotensin-converting enzyme-like [Dreissena polymorpha]KAH3705131.1 hypothetical protein DPMN_080196 [Dreissena polymorpha]
MGGCRLISVAVLLFVVICEIRIEANIPDDAKNFLEHYNQEVLEQSYLSNIAEWNYATNITDYNSQQSVKVELEFANFTQQMAKEAKSFNYSTYPNEEKRQFESISTMGTDAMRNETKLARLKTVLSLMDGIYGKGQVCNITKNATCYSLEPDLTQIMAESRDYELLEAVWRGWREVPKGQMRNLYPEFVQLSNEAVRDDGYFNDTGEYWRSWYEEPNFEKDLLALLDELRSLYENLHAYVRRKLRKVYNDRYFPDSGHIQAHLLGNMWAQSWINIYDIVEPFPGKESIDVTPELRSQNYTALKMFKVAAEFFISLRLRAMPKEFWNFSMITKPTDGREVICHASAWDFMKGNDVRIKMCTDITMDDLVTIHHEMGHIQYYLQYQQQPYVFRNGANPGFHEAIGDVMALSVSTPKHLHKIGLLPKLQNDKEADLNFLMRQALDKVAFLPFGYLIDQWRWSVFRGDTTPEQYTEAWWNLRCRLQGVSPPLERTSEDFDPGAKYHIPGNTPYIRYFVSFVIQFQFHKALCEAANETGPLHQCDIYNSAVAGEKLARLLHQGSSKPWPEIFQEITGSPKMSTAALKEYFQPLTDWLINENKGHKVGWDNSSCPKLPEHFRKYPSAAEFLEYYNTEASRVMTRTVEAQWNYGSNITDYNQEVLVNVSLEQADFAKRMYHHANQFNWKDINDPNVRRQFEKIINIGTSALDDKVQLKQMADMQARIEGIYGKAKVQMSDGRTLALEPGLTEIMKTSRNYTELKDAWLKWRDATGPKMRQDYATFVTLSNKAVKQLGYNDTGDYWRSAYESQTFQTDLRRLLQELQPLYRLLHAYVRKQLAKTYGAENFPTSGHIPAHLLGNMWAQQWNNIYDLVEPYRGVEEIDVTPEMIKQNYTVRRMFEAAEAFFISLGLDPMPPAFWNKTIMVNPPGVTMVCHASAWDFYNQKDFRIKMCTEVNMEELIVVHHEMGHIQYFLQYKNQPVVFREGANPGFHEAIGDVMALSVSTPKHLQTMGLLKDTHKSKESDINFLMKMALEKIAFLPFGYLIDQWRWSVFSGETPPEAYNRKWWELRCHYQGISPPVERSENDFDPGAKYHIPANVPYIRYFVSFVVQFQFHATLCREAGHIGPLHECDIYDSKAAGKKLGDLLKMGSSKPWAEAMQQFAGTTNMSAAPLMEYFKPLTDWLSERVTEDELGWSDNCTHVTEGDQLKQWLQQYEQQASDQLYREAEAEWTYNTNITEHNAELQDEAHEAGARFKKDVAERVSKFRFKEYKDEALKRRLSKMADIGPSALKNETQLKQLLSIQSRMEGIYSTAKVNLSTGSNLNLDPDLEDIIASSTDYDLLLDVWKGWRDVTGRRMKTLYSQFVEISNEAHRALGYKDTGDAWRSMYESDSFRSDLEHLLEQLKPLYQNLHTYVRRKLVDIYGAERFPASGHIPAHLLGNMWAQEWNNLYTKMIPFPKKQSVDVTDTLKQKGYNATGLFRIAEEFFRSLGMSPMRQEFWDKSMIVRPQGREVVCHGSAWDFYNAKDFRIKMCTDINMEDLITIHHEMGHIEYQMAYMQQPIPFRDGANPGFHEAIGDVMSLSVQTPKHLRRIGLLADGQDDDETEINFLFMMALDKIAFLPFGYLMDQWRWSVFSGETPPEQYNDKWWDLRCKHQGISPPTVRNSEDFDPGAKFHIPGNTPYIRYFVSYVIQFQFHQALCRAANQTGPLHRCDIYQSKEAGRKLLDMLELGSSRPWPEAMTILTGQSKMDVSAIIEYFRPLITWLEKQNQHERSGWSPACPSPAIRFPVTARNEKIGGSDVNAGQRSVISGILIVVYVLSYIVVF